MVVIVRIAFMEKIVAHGEVKPGRKNVDEIKQELSWVLVQPATPYPATISKPVKAVKVRCTY
jgi:hypothetical protein